MCWVHIYNTQGSRGECTYKKGWGSGKRGWLSEHGSKGSRLMSPSRWPVTTRYCGKQMRRNKKWRSNGAQEFLENSFCLVKCEKAASTFSFQGIRFIPQTPRRCLGNLDHCARVNLWPKMLVQVMYSSWWDAMPKLSSSFVVSAWEASQGIWGAVGEGSPLVHWEAGLTINLEYIEGHH